jgi:hypothetical protein
MKLFTAEHPTSADYRRDALVAVDRLMALRQRLEEAGPLPPELAPLVADVAAGLNDVESFWFAIGQALALHDPRSGAA